MRSHNKAYNLICRPGYPGTCSNPPASDSQVNYVLLKILPQDAEEGGLGVLSWASLSCESLRLSQKKKNDRTEKDSVMTPSHTLRPGSHA